MLENMGVAKVNRTHRRNNEEPLVKLNATMQYKDALSTLREALRSIDTSITNINEL